MRYFTWRRWLGSAVRLWRTSLLTRTVTLTLLLSTLAVLIIGGYISISVGTNLFDARRSQLLTQASHSAFTVQSAFNQTTEQGSTLDIENATDAAYTDVLQSSGTTASNTQIAILRSPRQPGPRVPIDVATKGAPTKKLLSAALRSEVAQSSGGHVYWQSISIPTGSGSDPGIAIGSRVTLQGSGNYEFYLIYDLSDSQQTLTFLQGTLGLGGLALILLIGAVTWVVVRLVVGPIRAAAETAQRLAAGELEQRMPARGDDVLATLARSFNGMADSLQRQIVRLATLSQVQQRFVSDVSHELRTPLTTIRLAGDVLYDQRDDFPPATARTAELLRTQVQRFELLLADLLEMSRYDAGAVQIDTEPTNLVRLVEDAVDAVTSLAETKGSRLEIVAPGGYFEAEVEARRIRRILQNLLGNAIDHGEGKPIIVYVDSNETAVAIAVRDYGIGMTSAAMERVFDRFWRADPSRQRTTGGTGLGLAISLEDAALHGGWLEVWSAPGEGSCFRLTLPRTMGGILTSSPLELPPDEDGAGDD